MCSNSAQEIIGGAVTEAIPGFSFFEKFVIKFQLRNPVENFTYATVKGSSVDMYFRRQVTFKNIQMYIQLEIRLMNDMLMVAFL